MNDTKTFEQQLASGLDQLAGPRRPVDALAISRDVIATSPQWRFQSMFSATKFVVSGVVVALLGGFLVSGVLTEPTTGPAAPGDSTLVVAQDGSGDFTTISEAIETAEDGATVLVRPGTYTEAIVIDKDITLTGDGEREAVIIALSDGVTPVVTIADSEAVLSNLTLTGEKSQVLISGGTPTLEGLLFDGVGIPYAAPPGQSFAVSLWLTDGTRARVTGNTFVDGGEISVRGGSAPLIDDNELSGGPHVYVPQFGDGMVIRGNTVSGALVNGILVGMKGSLLIEGNTIIDADSHGIRAIGNEVIRDNTISGSATGISVESGAPKIEGNVLTDNETGMMVAFGTRPTIEGNELIDNRLGIGLVGSDALVVRNTITSGEAGIVVTTGGSPTLDSNTVRGASIRGIAVGGGTSPTLTGNAICDNATNLFVDGNAAPVIDETNEICEDVVAEPSE